ncbi:MAG: extracellular solute-binding protein [Anaerolineae bacterium]|nr:extracellular solute-binding protein [Anaerolineae bacterium]
MEATSDLETLYAPAPSLLAGGAFGGRLFAFPLDVSGYACYTNDALWRDAGLDPARDFPDTWEAMRDVAEQLTVRDAQGAITQRGFDFNWSAPLFIWLQFEPMVRQLGSALVDEQTFTVTIDTPEAARVMAYWTDWANEWNLGGPDFEDTRVSFLKGLLATECTFGIGGAAQIEAARIDWSVHPVPTWADAVNENRGAVFANLLMVNAASPLLARAAAWKLAWFLLDHPRPLLRRGGHVPAARRVHRLRRLPG